MINQLSDYIRTTVVFPDDSQHRAFDPQTQVIVGGELPDDPVDMVLMIAGSGVIAGFPQNRQDVPVQFLCRGDTHGRARDIAFAIFNADSLGSVDAAGRKFKERHSFYLKQGGIRVARFSWIQPPFSLGADNSGHVFSFNAMVVFGDE